MTTDPCEEEAEKLLNSVSSHDEMCNWDTCDCLATVTAALRRAREEQREEDAKVAEAQACEPGDSFAREHDRLRTAIAQGIAQAIRATLRGGRT